MEIGTSILPAVLVTLVKISETGMRSEQKVWTIFDSGGENSYASRELLQWASTQGEQELELSTLHGTTPVRGTVLTFLAKHDEHGEEIPIKTLITPNTKGQSMKLKPKTIQIPKQIADKY